MFSGSRMSPEARALRQDGFVVLPHDARVERWAQAAYTVARGLVADPEVRKQNLRHGNTWFVGVDALPNDTLGAVDDVPLHGPWADLVPSLPLHRAQLSIVYPGYPQRDPKQSEPNHQFRVVRKAAHVDGLLPEGPEKRRFAREYHAYILGLPLNATPQAPTVVWKGSHHIVTRALRDAIADRDPSTVDLTDAYAQARRKVFEGCPVIAVNAHSEAKPGTSFLIHRLAMHGTDPWPADFDPASEGRMVAFFRPAFDAIAPWLADDG